MAYTYSNSITINASKCGTANSTSFPLYFPGASFLATTQNGGYATSPNGYDIAFFSDSALSKALPFELVSYSPTTGAGEWWIQVPTLSASTNTTLYVAYGNSAITATQSTPTSVWDAGYSAVFHFGQAGTLSATDSTSNAYTGTASSGVTAATGVVNGAAAAFNGSAQIGLGDHPNVGGSPSATFEVWLQRGSSSATGTVMGQSHEIALSIGIGGASQNQVKATKYADVDLFLGSIPADTNWHHVVLAYGSSGVTLYVDGAVNATLSDNSSIGTDTSSGGYIGYSTIEGTYWTGLIDEARFSTNATRSASWVTASYNNQSAPTSFYSIGSQQSASQATAPASSGSLLFLGW